MNGNPNVMDLDDYRRRSEKIVRARHSAIEEYQRQGLAEAEAEHDYRKSKAVSLARVRSEGKSVTEAEVLAEGEAAGHKKLRDTAHVLARSSLLRVQELERNAASLRTEFQGARDLNWSPAA